MSKSRGKAVLGRRGKIKFSLRHAVKETEHTTREDVKNLLT